jgi:hypothetical protein
VNEAVKNAVTMAALMWLCTLAALTANVVIVSACVCYAAFWWH